MASVLVISCSMSCANGRAAMRVSFENARYELMLTDGLRFHVLLSWFPTRRFLRAAKRIIAYGVHWLPTISVFMPTCLLTYGVLCRMGLIRWDEIAVELVSIVMGSIVLLLVKETLDSEHRRRLILKFQYSKLREWDYRSHELFVQLCCAMGIDWMSVYPARCPVASVWAGSHYGCTAGHLDKSVLLEQIRMLLNVMCETAEERGFIDWNSKEATSIYQWTLDALSRADCDDFDAARSMKSLSQGLCDVSLMIGRPWSYRIDDAHIELVRRFLKVHAVKVGY